MKYTHDQMEAALYLFLEISDTIMEIIVQEYLGDEDKTNMQVIRGHLKGVLENNKNPAMKKIVRLLQDQHDFYSLPEISQTIKDEGRSHFIGNELYEQLCEVKEYLFTVNMKATEGEYDPYEE